MFKSFLENRSLKVSSSPLLNLNLSPSDTFNTQLYGLKSHAILIR
jgi:hypothetical protein